VEVLGAGDHHEEAAPSVRRYLGDDLDLLARDLVLEVEPARVVLDDTTYAASVGDHGELDFGSPRLEVGVLDEVGHPLVDGQLHHLQAEGVEGRQEGALPFPRLEERVDIVHDGLEVTEAMRLGLHGGCVSEVGGAQAVLPLAAVRERSCWCAASTVGYCRKTLYVRVSCTTTWPGRLTEATTTWPPSGVSWR